MRHLVSVLDLSSDDVLKIFKRAAAHKGGYTSIGNFPNGRPVLAALFYEPSTRTRLSFEAAMHRLGGSVISTENAGAFSSAAKGETLEDSIRIVSEYCHVIALRHPEAGAAARAAAVSDVPIVNAGDGDNEHPSQALLDLFTIWEAAREGRISEPRVLRVHFYGDNLKSRTVRSLALMLGRHADALGLHVEKLYFGGPYRECAQPSKRLYDEILGCGISSLVIANSGLGTPANVVYLTRVQKERYPTDFRFTAEEPADSHEAQAHWPLRYERTHAAYVHQHGIIMHPLPRAGDLSPEVDDHPSAQYFEQARNGLYIRMALIEFLLAQH